MTNHDKLQSKTNIITWINFTMIQLRENCLKPDLKKLGVVPKTDLTDSPCEHITVLTGN